MRTFRLFPDRTSVPVQWRVGPFRLRAAGFLWLAAWCVIGFAMSLVSLFIGIPIILFGVATTLGFAVYVFHSDPKMFQSETGLLRMTLSGARNLRHDNETTRN